MKLHLVCLLLFLHAILASFTFNHYDPYGVPLPDDYETVTCVVDNDCATAVGRPYCTNITAIGQSVCTQCFPISGHQYASNCMCPAGQYCIAAPNDSNFGFCKNYESEILDSNCDPSMHDDPMSLIQGVNDTVFCGKVAFGSDLHAITVEWEGECIRGKCLECGEPPIMCVPLSLCNDGRSCLLGKEVYPIVGVFSFIYTLYVPMFLGIYISFFQMVASTLVMIFGTFGVGIYFYKYKMGAEKTKRYSKIINEDDASD